MIPRPLKPPHQRTETMSEGDLRHATWLELFYDLVFVVAVTALATRLKNEYSPIGMLQFIGLFLPVWWAWVGHTIYAARFDTDALVHRFGTLAMILAASAILVLYFGMYLPLPLMLLGLTAVFIVLAYGDSRLGPAAGDRNHKE
jgi:low temperature requirement protein LtrA